jgi:upstream activation factor subunit UAF30
MLRSSPSDRDLQNAVESIVSTLDIESATLKNVRAQVEAQFGCDLSDRKPFIKEVLVNYLQKIDHDQLDTNVSEIAPKKSSNSGINWQYQM